MYLRSQGRIRICAVCLAALIGLAMVGALVVWTNERLYMEQKYASRFKAGKKSSLSLVIASKRLMVRCCTWFYKKNANSR